MRKAGYAWLWLGVTCLLSRGATSQPQPRTSNACYSSGGDCGIHSLTCEHGLVILVGDTHYGFKDRASYRNHTCQALLADCGAYVNRESCCGYDVNADCLTSFSREHRQRVKEDCDGKTTCQARATYVSGSCSKPRHVYNDVSSYSVISYACVNATSRRLSTASQPVSCGPRCTSTTSKAAFEDRTGENNSNQKENDERMLQLIIGVSVGVGSGFIFLFVVLIFCWFRLRRKPQASISVTNGTTLTAARTISRRPSKANTLTSTMPSSHYSSFFYSDTLPSSHPGSVYPESIYSVPVDASPPGSIGPASLVRAYGYSNVELVPRVDPSGQLNRPPQLSERVSFPPASDSDGSAAIPPQLPARPNSLKPATSLEGESENINGRLVVSSQPSGRRSESGTSSSLHSQQKSLRRLKAPRNKKPSKPFTNSSGLSSDSSSGRENAAPVHSNQVAALHRQAARDQSPETSHHNGSTSSHREWWNPLLGATRNSVQSDHTSEASSVWAAPQEMVVETIRVCQHTQDKHEVVESWLGKVKPQVPF